MIERMIDQTIRCGALLFCISGLLLAQSPAFEVASVKPGSPGDRFMPGRFDPGGGFEANTEIEFLIERFYSVKSFQVVGAPAWVNSERYRISAKSPAGTVLATPPGSDKEMPLRIQALLKERFHLEVHRETREMPCYVLAVAKGGPKLKTPDPAQDFRLHLFNGSIVNEGGAKMAMLATLLENQLDRKVFDETGLTDSYRFDLKWAPDQTPPNAPAEMANRPSLFTALQEQLGLKLESAKRPVEMLVIDHIERPTEN